MRLTPATWPWPLPALLAWGAPWLVLLALGRLGVAPGLALGAALAAAVPLALQADGPRRRLLCAIGFPLSAALLAGAAWPAWGWLAAAATVALIYPLRAWRDAPLFPTPPEALLGLPACIPHAPQRLLDAGCGLGHGLAALRRAWPQAELHGVEISAVMAWLAARRCRGAHIVRGDMWRHPWWDYDLVYLFQRPESMARAWAKAREQMRPGAWLASLEFAVPGVAPHAAVQTPGGARALWLYRVPGPGSSGSAACSDSTAPAAGR
jgi:SAM-dependent methyltransferase